MSSTPEETIVKETTFLYGANVRANGIRQHYLRFGGKGRVIVLVPGIISQAAIWAFVGDRLGQKNDVYVLDVRGRGLSESGAHLDYGLDACADDVIAFAGALGLSDYTILGHSMGARIAIRAARRNDPALKQLILIDPPVSGPGRRPYPSPLEGVLKLLHAAQRGEAMQALTAPGVKPWPQDLMNLRAEWLHTCDERAAVVASRSFHEDDIHADLPHITIPAALIIPEHGDVIRPEEEAEIKQLIPHIDVRHVADGGHQIQVDNFEGLMRALDGLM